MKSLILALTLINAPVEEQDLMLADLYDADPRLAGEVLDMADDIADSTGGEEAVLVIDGAWFYGPGDAHFGNITVDDSTNNPEMSNWTFHRQAGNKMGRVELGISTEQNGASGTGNLYRAIRGPMTSGRQHHTTTPGHKYRRTD